MKLGARIWILILFVVSSITLIISGESSTKLLVFSLLIGASFVLTIVKSKKGAIFISLIFVAIAAFLIFGTSSNGVVIESINHQSDAFSHGLRENQIITSVNGVQITDQIDYANQINSIDFTGGNRRVDITTTEETIILFTNQSPDLTVAPISQTNIRTGLDISGGARALVSPTESITEEELNDLIAVSRQRFNVFGLSDVKIRGVSDLEGNRFMLVEVAGATPENLESLISEQGKFEAKIGDQVVFTGGDKDITYVARSDATQSILYPPQGSAEEGYFARFSFAITLSPEAAQRHADITRNIATDPNSGGQYLSGNLTLVLDDQVVDELLISSSLKGQVTSQISIQGSGSGTTPEAATEDARASMNQLQAVLISGSLPYELEIVKLDTISPVLGSEFVRSIFLAVIVSIGLVSLIIFFRYKKLKISAALIMTALSEVIIILGIASLIRWNLDLPSIAGILATIGTGVDQQIVIIDEARTGKGSSLKQKMKRAIFVVMTAYLTSLVALLPLFKAGAGLFKGFAITTIIGITAGVFITRPAFAELVKRIESN